MAWTASQHQDFANWLHEGRFIPQELVERYGTSGPRYTSYPTAPMWEESFTEVDFRTAIAKTNQTDAPERSLPLSIYTHLPFCTERCLFCSCNVVITKQQEQAEKYLGYLFQEIDQVADAMGDSTQQRPVVQYHWGGGTPSYLSSEQMSRLFRHHQSRFTFASDAEISIEVDPRVTTDEQIHTLRELGFNRVSMGVQDFTPQVQEAVHRIQPVDMTAHLIEVSRKTGFQGINLDLIYGLPHQTVATFTTTLDTIIELSPDRIALYNYAHVPWMSPHQKEIPENTLPDGEEKLRIFRLAMERLIDAGYVYIGMDHFAKPTDELAQAYSEGTLHRNFMGYTTRAGSAEMYSFGVSAISGLQDYYVQNLKKLSTYYEAVTANALPTWRGFALSKDDRLRRRAIQEILCQGTLNIAPIEAEYGINFHQYFADALVDLAQPAQDGLIEMDENGLRLTPLGRILSRNIAMPFDIYLKQPKEGKQPLYSKTV